MKKIRFALLLIGVCFCLVVLVVRAMDVSSLTLGYYTGSPASYDAVQLFSSYLDIVSSDVFVVNFDGSLSGADDYDVLAYDKAHGLQTYACISNYNNAIEDFDPQLAHAVIVEHREKVIDALVSLAQTGDYDGVNIDFENLAYSPDIDDDRASFSAFIHDLAVQLHAVGIKLTISVPGKTADLKEETWSYPYDLAALGQDADYLQLMTYDQHGPWGAPGPVSAFDWVEQCVVYAASQVDPSKLLIGLPAYGYDWDQTASDPANGTYSAASFSWTEIPDLLAMPGAVERWDAAALSPSVTYTLDGHAHEAWYENPASIRFKAGLAPKYHLAGLSMWSLGQEDQSFWQAALQGTHSRFIFFPLIDIN